MSSTVISNKDVFDLYKSLEDTSLENVCNAFCVKFSVNIVIFSPLTLYTKIKRVVDKIDNILALSECGD